MTDLTTPMSHPQLPEQPRQPPISQPFPLPFPLPFSLPVPPPKRRTGLVLVVACLFAFAAAAVSAVLYVGADGDHDAAVARLGERGGELTDARARTRAAADARADAEARNTGLETEKATLTTCVDAVRHYLWDGLEGTERDTALDAMFTTCQ
jgi:hypothetical protein